MTIMTMMVMMAMVTVTETVMMMTTMMHLTSQVEMWNIFARRRIGESAKLICDSGSSEAALTTTLQASQIATLPGDAYGHVLCHIDLDLLSESATAPHMRQPPYKKQQLQRLVNSFAALRKGIDDNPTNNCKLIRGDVVVFRDGGKKLPGDIVGKQLVSGKGRWLQVSKYENLAKLTTHVLLSEDGLKERRSRVRGIGAIKQLTRLHAFMNADTVIPEKARVVFNGTNRGDVLGPVALENWVTLGSARMKRRSSSTARTEDKSMGGTLATARTMTRATLRKTTASPRERRLNALSSKRMARSVSRASGGPCHHSTTRSSSIHTSAGA